MNRFTLFSMVTIVLSVNCYAIEPKTMAEAKALSKAEPNIYSMLSKALRYLENAVSDDGELLTGSNNVQSTALVLVALLRNGASINSEQYGEVVRKAYKYILSSDLKTDDDKIASVVAMSHYYVTHKTSEAAVMVNKLLSEINHADGFWADFLSITRVPDESKRPSWALPVRIYQNNRMKETGVSKLESLADYQEMYLTYTAKNIRTNTSITTYNNACKRIWFSKQAEDGSFAISDNKDKFAATALVSLSLSIYGHGASHFYPPVVQDAND